MTKELGARQSAIIDVSKFGSTEEILKSLDGSLSIKVKKILTERSNKGIPCPQKLRLLSRCDTNSSLKNLQTSLQSSYANSLSFIEDEERSEINKTLTNAIEHGDSYEFKINCRLIHYLIVKEFTHENIQKQLVSWVWSSADQTTQQKIDFKLDMVTILDRSGKDSLAAIHIENIASQKFFFKMGFKIKWLAVESL